MNRTIYLGLKILDISKTKMYEFWYDYLKPKYNNKAMLCYMDTDSFIAHRKMDDIYKDISEDVETRFDPSNYHVNRSLPIGKNKKVLGLMKDKLGGQIMKIFVGLRPKTYAYLKGNDDEIKKQKGKKRCVIKRNLQIKDFKNCLKASQSINKANYLENKTLKIDSLKENHRVYRKQ